MLAVVPSLDNAKNCVTDLSFDHVLALARPVESRPRAKRKDCTSLIIRLLENSIPNVIFVPVTVLPPVPKAKGWSSGNTLLARKVFIHYGNLYKRR